tara:strand:- start:396 stop:1832 length:1437 start_codon:yes stop_codon:yes gene_type:complete
MGIFDFLKDEEFVKGLVKGTAQSTTKGVQDAMDTLDGRLSRLSEKRMARATTEQARHRQDFRDNEEEMKSLVAALGPEGAGIMHSLINENSYSGAKAIVPLVVKKMQDTKMSAAQVLNYKRADGSEPPSIKQLTDLVTIPMNIPDLDYGKALEGSGSHILNIFTNSEDGISKYAKKYIETDAALSGATFDKVDYGEIGTAGTLTVDRFELGLTNNLKDNLVKLKAASVNEKDPDKKKEYKERAHVVEVTIANRTDKPLTEPQKRSNKGSFNKSASEYAQIDGDIDFRTGDWISSKANAFNAKVASDEASKGAEALAWSKLNRGEKDKSAQGLVPNKLPEGFVGLQGNEGQNVSADRLIHAALSNGYTVRVVAKTDVSDPYITIGGKAGYNNELIGKDKEDNTVDDPSKTVFIVRGKDTLPNVRTNSDIISAISKIRANPNDPNAKIQAGVIKNVLAEYGVTNYKEAFKELSGLDWKYD